MVLADYISATRCFCSVYVFGHFFAPWSPRGGNHDGRLGVNNINVKYEYIENIIVLKIEVEIRYSI